MTRTVLKNGILIFSLCCIFSFSSFSQAITGIWRGYFIGSSGEQYRLEFQVKQDGSGRVSVGGVSYSWQDDIRFYGKATMTGSFVNSSQNFRIREIKTIEVKNPSGGGTCIMNYDLRYSRSGREEFLEGTYLGKPETKTSPNTFEWGDCGGGRVFLRRVTTTDFYIEPFLRDNKKLTSTRQNEAPTDKLVVPPTKKPVTPKPVTRKPTATNKPVVKPPVKKPATTTPDNTIPRKITAPQREAVDTGKKLNDLPKPVLRPFVSNSEGIRNRQSELMKYLVVNDPDVTVKLYDNGEIDDDSISVYLDRKLVLSNKRLSTVPLTIKLKMDESNPDHELVMVAENLGRIPPNTSLMIVEAGDQRFEVRITSTEQKNAVVRFRYQQP